jgi:adenosylcobinamide-GDP ribazoletransferase
MRAFWLALQFLTILPVPVTREFNATLRGRSVLFYPLIGLLIGGLLAAVHVLLEGAPTSVEAILLLIVWAVVTGALHLDGLADSADALVGAHGDRERALAIMKDPASGPAGVTALVLVLLLKYAALAAVVEAGQWPALVVAPLLGRAALVAVFLTTPYVRSAGIGAKHAEQLPRFAAIVVLALSAMFVALAGQGTGLWPLGGVVVTVLLARWFMLARLDGTTGDTLGAVCEITEAVALVAWTCAV